MIFQISKCFNYLQMEKTKTIAFAWFTCVWRFVTQFRILVCFDTDGSLQLHATLSQSCHALVRLVPIRPHPVSWFICWNHLLSNETRISKIYFKGLGTKEREMDGSSNEISNLHPYRSTTTHQSVLVLPHLAYPPKVAQFPVSRVVYPLMNSQGHLQC